MLALATSSEKRAKINEKSHVFWDIDFDRILTWFWEGFDRLKSSIFAFFSIFSRFKILNATWKAKNRKKDSKFFFPPHVGDLCGPGGKDLGWGEACLSLKFQALP